MLRFRLDRARARRRFQLRARLVGVQEPARKSSEKPNHDRAMCEDHPPMTAATKERAIARAGPAGRSADGRQFAPLVKRGEAVRSGREVEGESAAGSAGAISVFLCVAWS